MKTDFKIHRLIQHDNGEYTALVRVYEGEVTTEDEEIRGEMQPVTRYRRTKMIKEETYGLPRETDIRKHMAKELAKDKTRTPIPEQDAKVLR